MPNLRPLGDANSGCQHQCTRCFPIRSLRRVTDECPSLCDVDGSMRKTMKSKLLDLFNSEATRPTEKPWKFDSLVDMGLIWRLAIPTPEDREVRNWTDRSRPTIVATTWINYSALSSSHASQMHASKASSMTSTTSPSASRIKSITDEQQNIYTSQIFSPSLKTLFPSAVEFLKFTVTSGSKVSLQRLVNEQMKTQLGLNRTWVIYC